MRKSKNVSTNNDLPRKSLNLPLCKTTESHSIKNLRKENERIIRRVRCLEKIDRFFRYNRMDGRNE